SRDAGFRLAAGESAIRLDSSRSARLRGGGETDARHLVRPNLLSCQALLMLRATALSMTLLVLPWGAGFAGAPSDLCANAALKYWQVFAQLPRMTEAQEHKFDAECLTMPLDAHAREIVTRADYALRMMHRAAALPRCDWGIGYEDGIELLLPHVQAARMLSNLACLRARIRFQDGHNADAIEDIVAAMTLGRHVSLDGTLISVLRNYGIERRTGETLALYLPRLDAEMIKRLKA